MCRIIKNIRFLKFACLGADLFQELNDKASGEGIQATLLRKVYSVNIIMMVVRIVKGSSAKRWLSGY